MLPIVQIRLLNGAIDLNPGDMKVRLMRASCYRQKLDFEAALKDVETAADSNKRRFEAKNGKVTEMSALEKRRKNKEERHSSRDPKEEGKEVPPELVEPLPIVRQRNLIVSDCKNSVM